MWSKSTQTPHHTHLSWGLLTIKPHLLALPQSIIYSSQEASQIQQWGPQSLGLNEEAESHLDQEGEHSGMPQSSLLFHQKAPPFTYQMNYLIVFQLLLCRVAHDFLFGNRRDFVPHMSVVRDILQRSFQVRDPEFVLYASFLSSHFHCFCWSSRLPRTRLPLPAHEGWSTWWNFPKLRRVFRSTIKRLCKTKWVPSRVVNVLHEIRHPLGLFQELVAQYKTGKTYNKAGEAKLSGTNDRVFKEVVEKLRQKFRWAWPSECLWYMIIWFGIWEAGSLLGTNLIP